MCVLRVLAFGAVLATVGAQNPQPMEPTWQPLVADLLKAERPGYGGLCGVAVDHATGNLFIDLSDKGIYRSTDQGKTFKRMTASPLKGRTESAGCLMLDPTGKSKKLLVALVYGAPIALSGDDGETFKMMNAKSSHVDWAAIDWSDPKHGFVLALKHESGDLLIASNDGGQTFRDIGKGFGPAWVFDSKTAIVSQTKSKANPKPGLLRTTDAGQTFQSCGDYFTKVLPRLHGDTLYWLVEGALIASPDKGATWKKLGDLKDGRLGPVFGKDDKHLFVLTGQGIVESKDQGATWSRPLALPKELKGVSPLTWFDYDPRNDVLYVMKMSSDLYKLNRKK